MKNKQKGSPQVGHSQPSVSTEGTKKQFPQENRHFYNRNFSTIFPVLTSVRTTEKKKNMRKGIMEKQKREKHEKEKKSNKMKKGKTKEKKKKQKKEKNWPFLSPPLPLSTEARKPVFHKRKTSFLQSELLDDVFRFWRLLSRLIAKYARSVRALCPMTTCFQRQVS